MTEDGNGDEVYKALHARVQRPRGSAWIPSDDDPSIVGRLIDVEEGVTDYGSAKIAVLEMADGGERRVWLFHQVLKGEFIRLKPKIGDLVAISYQGRQATVDGEREFVDYRVVVGRTNDDPDWGALLSEGAPAEAAGVAEAPPVMEGSAACDDIPF